MKRPTKPVESFALPGMAAAVDALREHAAAYSGEQLTEKMRAPLADVSRVTRDIENDSPLFYGAINPTLF